MVSRLSRLRHLALAHEGIVAVVVTLLVAVVVGQLTTFGRSAGQDFYVAVAQVIPIFLLALLVEATGQFSGFERGAKQQRTLAQASARKAEEARESIERVKTDSRRLEERGGKVEGELAAARDELIRAAEVVIANSDQVAAIGAELDLVSREVRRVLLGYVAAAIPGEAAALYALAAETSTTFLLMTTTVSLGAMVVLFVITVLRRFTYRPGESEPA